MGYSSEKSSQRKAAFQEIEVLIAKEKEKRQRNEYNLNNQIMIKFCREKRESPKLAYISRDYE